MPYHDPNEILDFKLYFGETANSNISLFSCSRFGPDTILNDTSWQTPVTYELHGLIHICRLVVVSQFEIAVHHRKVCIFPEIQKVLVIAYPSSTVLKYAAIYIV